MMWAQCESCQIQICLVCLNLSRLLVALLYEVVGQILNDSCRLVGLDSVWVVGDEDCLLGFDDDDTLLSL